MSFTAKIEPSKALVGNSILVVINSQDEDKILMELGLEGQTLYSAHAVPDGKGRCVFRINDILKDLLPGTSPALGNELAIQLPDSVIEYYVKLSGYNSEITLSAKCYPGGISKKLMRHLSSQGTDIFAAKLLNSRGNFLLTTRSTASVIPFRETELGYLYFIATGTPFVISDLHGHKLTISPAADGSIYGFNLPEIRRRFFQAGSLSSYFRIVVNNKTSFVIVITPGHENAIVLEYKNSFGVFEKIELSGKVNITPDIKKQEYAVTFDAEIYDFTQSVERGEYVQVLTVESGYKTPVEMNSLHDLLLSDEIYLLENETKSKVMVSSSKMKYKQPMQEPTSVELKITFADQENYTSFMLQTMSAYLVTDKYNPIVTSQTKKIVINKNF